MASRRAQFLLRLPFENANGIAQMFLPGKYGGSFDLLAEAGKKPALPHWLKPGGLRWAGFCQI